MRNKKLKFLLSITILIAALLTFDKARSINLVLPFNTYAFYIEGVGNVNLYEFSVIYNFNVHKGNITFQIAGTKIPDSINIDLPKNMNVIGHYINNWASNLKLNKDYSAGNHTNRINFYNFTKNLDGYVFVVNFEGNETFEPNGRFIVSTDAKKN